MRSSFDVLLLKANSALESGIVSSTYSSCQQDKDANLSPAECQQKLGCSLPLHRVRSKLTTNNNGPNKMASLATSSSRKTTYVLVAYVIISCCCTAIAANPTGIILVCANARCLLYKVYTGSDASNADNVHKGT